MQAMTVSAAMTRRRRADVVRVRVPPRSLRNELRAIKIVWRAS